MPGISLLTNLDPENTLAMVRDVAQSLNFAVAEEDDWELSLRKGNLVLSMFLGALIPYCDFRVCLCTGPDRTTEIVIHRNRPWWTGAIGVHRVNNRAKELADEIEDALHDHRAQVLNRQKLK